jgi:hypothetical protein
MSIASDNNLLWVPQDIGDLLTVTVDGAADNTTVQGMLAVNAATEQWLRGEIDDNYYFDLLAQYEIHPNEFVGEVEEHIELLMRKA